MSRRFVSAFVATAIALSSAPAFASKARLLALGQDPNGSLYIDDTRNIFLNPAYLNRLTDFANFELGAIDPAGGNPNAEGGYFATNGAIKYGLQLGRIGEFSQFLQGLNTTPTPPTPLYPVPNDSVEAIVAGGADLKWGASLLYGSGENKSADPSTEAKTLEVRGGLATDLWQAYAHVLVMAESSFTPAGGAETKIEGNPSVRAGGLYSLSPEGRVYANFAWLNNAISSAGGPEADSSAVAFDAGYVRLLNPEAATRFFYSLGIALANSKVEGINGAGETKNENLFIPLLIGLENGVNDWLILRASVGQNVFINRVKTGGETSNAPVNSTTVGAGAGIKWNKFTLDATLQAATTGVINANSLLANAGFTYVF